MTPNDPEPPVGIPVPRARFQALVADYLDLITRGAPFDAEDAVTMVRLWNTIVFQRLAPGDALYARYAAAFFPAQIAPVTDLLHARPTKGMALYSREHDLYVGGTPHAASQFRLEPDR